MCMYHILSVLASLKVNSPCPGSEAMSLAEAGSLHPPSVLCCGVCGRPTAGSGLLQGASRVAMAGATILELSKPYTIEQYLS